MEDFLSRLQTEKFELDFKLEKLRVFLKTDDFKNLVDLQRELLLLQESAMSKYSDILSMRLNTI